MAAVKRAFALVMCFVLVLSLLFSISFITHEVSHDCAGEECRICAVITRCAETLEKLYAAASAISLFGFLAVFVVTVATRGEASCVSDTPVKLKVKLSD